MAPPAHTDDAKRRGVEQLIGRFLDDDSVRASGLLDGDRLRTFLDGWREDDDPVSLTRKDALLNHLLCLQILHAQFVAQEAPVPEAT
jgi:asparagine synthase (glutamine-hydrolysing)